MKKNTLILTAFAIILLVIAIIFYIYTTKGIESDVLDNTIDNTEELQKNRNDVSKTEDWDVEYKDFTFYDANRKEYTLADFDGAAKVVLFFSPDNEDSIEDLKKVNNLYKKYEEKVKFIMICSSKEVQKELEDELDIDIYYDFYEEAIRKYEIDTFPSFIYLKDNNEVFNSKVGFTTSDALDANFEILYRGIYINENGEVVE